MTLTNDFIYGMVLGAFVVAILVGVYHTGKSQP